MTAEAELKHLRLHLSKELQQTREDLMERLEQAQATAERRVEEHTEDYQLQVNRGSPVVVSFPTAMNAGRLSTSMPNHAVHMHTLAIHPGAAGLCTPFRWSH